MKEGIHPKYHEIEARCACGATWKTRSTKPELHLEICNNCHPFFTGRQKLIDTEGRVERFTKRFGAQTSESRKAAQKAAKKPAAPRSSFRLKAEAAGRRALPLKPEATKLSRRKRVWLPPSGGRQPRKRSALEELGVFIFRASLRSMRARRWRIPAA